MKLKSPTATPIHVALLSGEAIQIGPEPRDVPTQFRRPALAAGAVPEGVDPEDLESKAAAPNQKGDMEKLKEALAVMKTDGTKLNGAGMPDLKHVQKVVGWSVSKVELTEAWNSL